MNCFFYSCVFRFKYKMECVGGNFKRFSRNINIDLFRGCCLIGTKGELLKPCL